MPSRSTACARTFRGLVRAWPILLLLCLPACRSSGKTDLIESELRRREAELLEARAELNRLEGLNVALIRELQAVKPGFSTTSSPQFPRPNALSYSVQKIELGRLTGGYDDDGWPGDEALEVVVEPKDPDGSSIKAPGTLKITALAIDPQGMKAPFSSWDVPPEDLGKKWKSGLLGTGYKVILPWQTPPPSKKLRIIVRFTLLDGKTFEADKDITIRPPIEPRTGPPVLAPNSVPGPTLEEGPAPTPVPEESAASKPALWQRLLGKGKPKQPAPQTPVAQPVPAPAPQGSSLLDRLVGNVGKPPDWWKSGEAPTPIATSNPTTSNPPSPAPARAPAFKPRQPLLPAEPLGRPAPIQPLSHGTSSGPELIPAGGVGDAADSIWKPAGLRD